MRALFVTFLLAATAAPFAQDQQSAQKPAPVDGTTHRTVDTQCNCGTAYRSVREWHLHRPATPRERAETARLNRDYLASAHATPLPPPPGPDRAQQEYQVRLKNYRILTESYERRMRDYYRLHPAAQYPGQAYVPPSDETRRQDAARLDPGHGYNPGPGNGY